MPNGGKGAVAKVYIEAEVVDNFKQQAAKIKTGLGNGLKDLKDLDLNFGFDTESMAKAASEELNKVMDLATGKKLNKLDFSGIMPGMIDFLNNNEIADELKLQIVQGLRQGLEEFNQTATSVDINNLVRRGDGADVWSNLLLSNATKDIVGSFDLKKKDSDILLRQFRSLTSANISGDKGSFVQDLSQLLSLKATADKEEYQDAIKYLISGNYVDGRGTEQSMFDIPTIEEALSIYGIDLKAKQGNLTNQNIRDFAGYLSRLKFLGEVTGDERLVNDYQDIVDDSRYKELFESKTSALSKDQLNLFHSVMDKVLEASKYKDDQYQAIDKQAFNADILQAINALFTAAGDDGTIARLAPLIQGWEQKKPQLSADQLLADTIKSLGLKSEDKGLRQQEGSDDTKRAEAAADRAEQAADRAEEASDKAVQAAEDIQKATEDKPQTGAKKKDSSKPSTSKQSNEPAEQIADDAEADAENAEHVADALDDKKAQLESTITELENKSKELQELNDKYQQAISNTFGDIKTPEEALALFKEKAVQLQQADKDFAEIVPKRDFVDPSNSEEIFILEEYEKRLAALQQALVEYQKAGETAINKGVNPTDIRANQVDEERLQLNFADNTIDGYIKGLQKAIEDNDKKIKDYEDLLKTYRKQLEEFTNQTNQEQSAPKTNKKRQTQTQAQPAVETAREETGEVQKSREELQAEREKLQAEIQQSTATMNEAEKQLILIDRNIEQTQQANQRGDTKVDGLIEKKEQIESQIQQTKDELKTIKERLQDAVDAKQAAEEEIRALEEKLLNADGSNIFTADTPENASKYNKLKEKRDYAYFELNTINQPILDDLLQEQQSLEDALNRSYSVKTMDEAYKQAMQRKKEYLEKNKKYAEAVNEAQKYEIGSADWMVKIFNQQQVGAEQDAAWMAYYKSMQEFESHGKGETASKRSKREKLYAGVPSLEIPSEENAELVLSNLQSYLDKLNKQIIDRKGLVDLSQKELDELQQKIDELSSHVVTVDSISKQLEQKKQEQQKFEQEKSDWIAQQDTKQAELDNLNERLNGTKGVVNHLKATQDAQQNNQEELQQLQQQRDEQQRIYDEAKAIQIEKAQQLNELDRLIVEAEEREAAPPATPATNQRESSTSASDEQSPVVQNADQQLATLRNEEQQLTEKLAQITEEKANVEKIVQDIDDVLNKDVSVKTQKEAYNNAQFALLKASAVTTERADDPAPDYKDTNKWDEWFNRNREHFEEEKLAWAEYYKAMEEFESHGKETASKIANRRRLQPSKGIQSTRDELGFTSSEDLKQQLQAELQSNKEILSSYEQQEEEIQNRIKDIQQKKEQAKSSESPLSSSGAQTANGVQEEGAEAGDAAAQMEALAKAKKEALEANQQLAESANTTTNAIQDESSAGDFNTLILALTEIYELLSQLPQSFEGFKGFDLSGFTEPLNTLSETIQQLPKEGFTISLGDSFDNLASRIDEVLQKVQELTSQAKTAEIESNIAEKYDEQIKQLKADAEEAKRALEELKRTKQDVVQPTTAVKPVQSVSKQDLVATESTNVEPFFEDKIIGINYNALKDAQQKLFDAKNVKDFQAALQEVENILQRIQTLENEAVQKHATSEDVLYMAYNNSMSPNFESRMSESTKGRLESSSRLKSLTEDFVAQQQELVNGLQNSLNSIEIIPENARVNWGEQQREQYNKMAEGIKFAESSVEELTAVLNELQTKGFNSEQMQWFLELKDATSSSIDSIKEQNDTIQNLKTTRETDYLTKLTEAESKLQAVKAKSGDLINIDPSLASALQQIEQHLMQIKQIKDTITKNPFEVLSPQFAHNTESYISQLYGENGSQGVVEDIKQISDRSQADFSRMTTNYNKYASAMKKLFDDMSKGAGASLANLEEDLTRVNELATRLTDSTGLERDNLLTGELNPKAAPKVADAQAEAASKVGIAYETMFTKIESKAESAQSKINSIFGTEGITKGLESGFVEGTVNGFDDFVNNANKAGEALQHLQEIQEIIKNDKTWLTQKENITDYQQTMKTLADSLNEVTKEAGKFKVVDDLDVQKLRASTIQFIRDNPALSGGDISQLEGYIDQLQGKINSVDFDNFKAGIEGIKQSAIEAGRTGDTFFSMLTQRFKSLGAYLLSFVSFYRVIGVFKDGINIIHELDDALTEMQKVSDESLSSLREYQKSTFDTANQIGTTAAQLQTSTADWMRLGEDLQTASKSAQTANVLFNVSEFDSINDATTALVAMSAAYEDAANGLGKEQIIDRLNLIGGYA